ncbi:MAG TPA: cytochrome c oxidase assembly protein [Tetrasphaera sp.]|uniref:cytochrome c oxidase assembly protein n=1 Tax=Nostocoides sp. TaxID=1917966 RepID=UPI002BD6A88A|nr:cytochrome c oxidase assembly protein [Tetrasphaera sp.]HNQ07190.1 cytochrome c oxidase assembly protein [Tetrasphaera sp.]
MTSERGAVDRRPGLVLGLPALLAVAIFAALGGAVAAYAIGDPGPIARWSVPIGRVLRDLGACATIGLAILGAFLAPETTRTHRRATATRLAGMSAGLWLAGLVIALLGDFAEISGLTPAQPRYWSQFFGLAFELAPTRMSILSLIVVGAIIVLTGSARGTQGLAWVTVLGWLALMPQALAGHSAVSRDHMSSINALAVHLIAVTSWVGGLLALAIMSRSLAPHLAVTTARFSTLAGWSYAAIALSGLLAAWFNLSAIGDLATAYGAMLIVKASALVLLGVAGWWHRRRLIARLDTDADDRTAFVRLVLGELVLMGVALGTAVALAASPPPALGKLSPDPTSVYRLTGYPDPGPPPADAWVSVWHTDWLWVAIAALAIGIYVRWALRLRARGVRWPAWQTLIWVIGWLIFVYAMCGAPGVYGRIMFSWHMIMHMTIAMLVPLFLVPAAPITLALRALPARPDKTMGPREFVLALVHSRYLQVVANPVVAAVIFFFSLATFYFTPLFTYALATHTGHVLMTVHFLLSGYLFAWVLVGTDPGPKRWSPLILLVVLFATISFHAFLGVIITGSTTLLAPDFYSNLGLGWLPDPIPDQQRGGAIAWGIGEAPTLALAIMVTIQWLRQDRRETVRLDRQADRDHDAELTAYNAYLASLAERDRKGAGR